MNIKIQREYEDHMANIIKAVKEKTGVLTPEEFNYLLEEKVENYSKSKYNI